MVFLSNERRTIIHDHFVVLQYSLCCQFLQDVVILEVKWRLVYHNFEKVRRQELNGTSIDVVYSHSNEIPNKFALDVKERQDRLPTM